MAPIRLRHPAPDAADHYRSGVTAEYLKRQFEMVLLVPKAWLVDRNNKSPRAHGGRGTGLTHSAFHRQIAHLEFN